MSATPTEEQVQERSAAEATPAAAVDSTADLNASTDDAEQAFAEEDLSIPEEVPSADDPSSRATTRSLDDAGFTLDEFAALLSKIRLQLQARRHRQRHRFRP